MEKSLRNSLKDYEQEIEIVENTRREYEKWLVKNDLEESEMNYVDFINSIPYQYTRDQCKEIIDCFLVYCKEDNSNVVLVDKNNEENVIVLDSDFTWVYSYSKRDRFVIHIRDKGNKVNIRIKNVIEFEDRECLDIGEWLIDVM